MARYPFFLAIGFLLIAVSSLNAQVRIHCFKLQLNFAEGDEENARTLKELSDLERTRFLGQLHAAAIDLAKALNLDEKESQKLKVLCKKAYTRFARHRNHHINANINQTKNRTETFFILKDATHLDRFVDWNKILRTHFDESQMDQHDQWLRDRFNRQKKIEVRRYVAKIDRKLILSAHQRERLEEIVDRNIGNQLALLNMSNEPSLSTTEFSILVRTPRFVQQVQEILSEPQIKIWRAFVEPDFQSISFTILPTIFFDGESNFRLKR